MPINSVCGIKWHLGVAVIITAQYHLAKPELWFSPCVNNDPVYRSSKMVSVSNVGVLLKTRFTVLLVDHFTIKNSSSSRSKVLKYTTWKC